MSYPTLVYRCPGPHFAHAGQTYDYRKAESDDALQALLKNGWHLSLVDAVDAAINRFVKDIPADVQTDDDQVTRAELEEMATDLDIKFDGRTTDAALLRKIEAATGGEG